MERSFARDPGVCFVETTLRRAVRMKVLFRKRVLVLLRAAAILRMRVPESEVRIVGGGPEASRLRLL